jgi:hypothetical protein
MLFIGMNKWRNFNFKIIFSLGKIKTRKINLIKKMDIFEVFLKQ